MDGMSLGMCFGLLISVMFGEYTASQGTAKPFWKSTGRRSPCTRRRKRPLMKQGAKAAEGQGIGCGVRRTADQEEIGLPGLPQSERRNAGASSCAEKRRTVLCRRKEQRRKNEVSINNDSLGSFPHGRVLGYLFCYKSVWDKRAACIGKCKSKGLGALPNKRFATQKSPLYIRRHCLLVYNASFQVTFRPGLDRNQGRCCCRS